ncbi:DUF4224 domain-containing protein [Collimonas fungivorans]|uniref:DUF4224 domain-containing protein n=1 Tax=Collimonas fungivorans TaxID=158899 RepID=UPI00167FC805
MDDYLTASQIATLVGCRNNSYSCMRRWLDKNSWPYAKSITGFPIVSRAYHDARMSGTQTGKPSGKVRVEPNFGALAA